MATDPLLLIQDLITTLSGRRPVVVALLVIAICFVLLRPRRKPQRPSSTQGAGSSSDAAAAPQQKLPALSLSTRDILLEFANGSPQLKQVALEPLFRLCARHQVFLVTQLPVDSDELEAAVVALLEGAGVFAEGRRARPRRSEPPRPSPFLPPVPAAFALGPAASPRRSACPRTPLNGPPAQVRAAQGDVLLHRGGARRHVPAARPGGAHRQQRAGASREPWRAAPWGRSEGPRPPTHPHAGPLPLVLVLPTPLASPPLPMPVQVVQYLAPLPDGPQQLVFVSAAGDSLQPAKGTVVSVASLAAYASLPARGTEA